jgi:3'(2'), 5'-bisphosphate nucleotidase
MDNIRMVMSSSHGCNKLEKLFEKYNIKNHIKTGSSIKGCIIAKGDAEVYYRFNPTMEWDTAAMQCIAEQAGAIFRQADGAEMFYNRENSLNEKGFFIVNRTENMLEL